MSGLCLQQKSCTSGSSNSYRIDRQAPVIEVLMPRSALKSRPLPKNKFPSLTARIFSEIVIQCI
jgi:hypothetical protein